ncbi:hypothetical protein MTR67_051297 [Solanum verrucosum]|uniref:Gag-pol polyprotein n=1 Tax=Solanum verrucosum TaxID=315347 RepID=A0AAF0V4M0_SOLVR|nr:hypothetical protein MTR67_051297 [Solanum verrucosum]
MNPLKFHGSEVNEDPQEFIDELYEIVEIMGVSPVEKVELIAYQLKGASQVWFKKWKEERNIDAILFIYALIMVVGSGPMMSKFVPSMPEMRGKKAKTGDGDFSHLRSCGHGRSKLWQCFSCQGYSNAPTSKFNKEDMSNPKPQGGNGGGCFMTTCTSCGKKHDVKCMIGTNGFFSCEESGHKMKDCPLLSSNGRYGRKAQPRGSSLSSPKQNKFYAFQTL